MRSPASRFPKPACHLSKPSQVPTNHIKKKKKPLINTVPALKIPQKHNFHKFETLIEQNHDAEVNEQIINGKGLYSQTIKGEIFFRRSGGFCFAIPDFHAIGNFTMASISINQTAS
jgi:hypothetical protein